MKGGFLFKGVAISSSVIGAVIGAGFITGTEIVTFFSGSFLLPSCALLFLLVFFFVWALLSVGRELCGQNAVNLRVLGGFSYFFNCCIKVFSFISLAAMCAGIDAVAADFFGNDWRIPTLSPIVLVASFFICKRGIRGVEMFNLCLVPVMIVVILFACVGTDGVDITHGSSSSAFKVLIYAAMNCFMSSAVIIDSGKGASRKSIFFASIVCSVVISVCTYLIMSKISTGYGTDENLPLLSSIDKRGVFYIIFSVATMFGIVTTLVCSHYPLIVKTQKSGLNLALNVCLMICALALSRMGLNAIVNYLYPFMGLVGLFYVIAVCLFSVRKLFPSLQSKLFDKPHKRVHSRGKQAEDKGGCVD